VVFAGRHASERLLRDHFASTFQSRRAEDDPLQLLTSVALDRLAPELQRAGFVRGPRATATERWHLPDRATVAFTHVSGDEDDAGGTWVEYASLLTVHEEVEWEGRSFKVRLSSAPALLALGWDEYRRSGQSPLGSTELEDIVSLVAGRRELAREVRTAPQELRAFVAAEAHRFLAYDAAETVISRALPPIYRAPPMIARVIERFREIST
jgi:hypothetical protein